MTDLPGTLKEAWSDVEQRLDEVVRRAQGLLPPSQEELTALSRRLESVAQRLSALERARREKESG